MTDERSDRRLIRSTKYVTTRLFTLLTAEGSRLDMSQLKTMGAGRCCAANGVRAQ